MITPRCFGFAVASFALSSLPSRACLHFLEDEPLAPPKPLTLVQKLQQRTSRGEWEQRARDLKKTADAGFDYRSENNLSVALAHTGQLDEALQRMQTIERTAPGHLETAYNLATVMELRGDLPGAKKWLREGFERELRTVGHLRLDGTEWLHERILDAQIAARHGAALHSSIAGLDFGTGKIPHAPAQYPQGLDEKPVSLDEASRSLFEQLHERLEFVQAPDPVVGDLLFDLANAQTLQNGNTSQDDAPDQATPLYQMALDFGSPRVALVQRRFAWSSGQPNWPLIACPFLLCLAGAGLWKIQRARRERTQWQQIPIAPWQPPKFLPHLEWKDANEETMRQSPNDLE